jgi:hypothetical protein
MTHIYVKNPRVKIAKYDAHTTMEWRRIVIEKYVNGGMKRWVRTVSSYAVNPYIPWTITRKWKAITIDTVGFWG